MPFINDVLRGFGVLSGIASGNLLDALVMGGRSLTLGGLGTGVSLLANAVGLPTPSAPSPTGVKPIKRPTEGDAYKRYVEPYTSGGTNSTINSTYRGTGLLDDIMKETQGYLK